MIDTEVEDLNLSLHQQFCLGDINQCKLIANQRKCVAHLVKVSSKVLNNENSSRLLSNKLSSYSDVSDKFQESIYNDKLKVILSNSNRTVGNNFKSKLGIVNPKQFINSLPCTTEKSFCSTSENVNENEFEEFLQIFRSKKYSSSNLNSGPLLQTGRQNFKQILYPESRFSSSVPAANSQKKDSSNIFNNCFKTAREELDIQSLQKYGSTAQSNNLQSNTSIQQRKVGKLGSRRGVKSKFISPLITNSGSNEDVKSEEAPTEIVDERLKNIEPKMVELIKSEIMDCTTTLHWNDIAGLRFAKTAIQEAVVWPMLRPDIFTGLRRPPKGILLFGPPGTGKTLIGKCVASQSKSTFFSISASSLTSKWVGDGEKMVRALFAVARVHQPAVIFIDEVDSLLSQRTDTEHESSRRIKTEFLVQLDGATTDNEERILVIGATNRPQELDEAARRRFVKRLYIPLPEYEARLQLVQKLIMTENHRLQDENFEKIADLSDGYSGADIKNLCSEASLGPIRSIDMSMIEHIQANDVRPLMMEDFEKALTRVKSSVSPKDLEQYVTWDKVYGSGF